jgi:Kae1-associated kinase Bud32
MTYPKIIAQGAEATITFYKRKNWVFKDRISKSYRIPEIDDKIRKSRTKAEVKLLEKASQIINVPVPEKNYSQEEHFRITMPFIKGKKLSDNLEDFSLKKQKQILRQIGKDVAKLHDANIIHGDLTTSNMILVEDKIFFIDFGLGFISHKFEDKAVDVHLLKQALEAKHFKNWKILYQEFEKGYKSANKKQAEKTLNQMIKVEKRGRYKH